MTRARRNETFTSVLQRYECVAAIRVHYTDASVLQWYERVAAKRVCCSGTSVLQQNECVAAVWACCSKTSVLQRYECVAAKPVCCSGMSVLQQNECVAVVWACCSVLSLAQCKGRNSQKIAVWVIKVIYIWCMALSPENATPLKSTISRSSNSSYKFKPKTQFEFVSRIPSNLSFWIWWTLPFWGCINFSGKWHMIKVEMYHMGWLRFGGSLKL